MRKLSKSGQEDALILKGGLFIYTLTNFESRATVDVDFLLRSVSDSLEEVQALIIKILAAPTGNDYIEMTAKGFEKISPQRKYHGISTQIIGKIKNVRVPFNVDIGGCKGVSLYILRCRRPQVAKLAPRRGAGRSAVPAGERTPPG